MTGPDYPLLSIPGHDLFQLAQVASFIADRLQRHRGATVSRDRQARREAARDVHTGRRAFARLSGNPDAVSDSVPRPLDTTTYEQAEELAAKGERRTAVVVSLAPLGRTTWAVIGEAPGLGRLGAEVPRQDIAEALATHMRGAPRQELLPWLVSKEPLGLGPDRWGTADDDATLASLDPSKPQEAAVVQALAANPTPAASALQAASLAAGQPNAESAATRSPAGPVAASMPVEMRAVQGPGPGRNRGGRWM